jgi:hypothetical protein
MEPVMFGAAPLAPVAGADVRADRLPQRRMALRPAYGADAQKPTYDGPERRVDRLTIPRCDTCGSPHTAVVGRTDYWLYVRCSGCGFIWSLCKPGAPVAR